MTMVPGNKVGYVGVQLDGGMPFLRGMLMEEFSFPVFLRPMILSESAPNLSAAKYIFFFKFMWAGDVLTKPVSEKKKLLFSETDFFCPSILNCELCDFRRPSWL